MWKIAKHLITGVDNETGDIGRVILICGIAAFIYFSGVVVLRTGTFNPQDFGIGFGAICAGAGALLKFKENTEPKVHD